MRHGFARRALAALVVTLVGAVALSGCGDDDSTGPDGRLLTNAGGNGLTAGEFLTDPGQLVTFGIGTVENVSADDITLVELRPNLFGDIELAGVLVAGADREAVWIASDSTFPPDDSDLGTVTELDGHVMAPPRGRPGFASDNLLIGLRVGGSTDPAGMDGYCLDYRVGTSASKRTQCWPEHRLVVCADLDAPACTVPGSSG